jgi:hypothetical protein
MSDEPADEHRMAIILGDASFIIAMFAPLLCFLATPYTEIAPEAHRRTLIDAAFFGIHAVAVGLGVISLLRKANACAYAGIALGAFWPVAVWLFSWVAAD